MKLFAKSNLNSINVLISKVLIDSNISHDEFVSINNVLKEFFDMKEETKNPIDNWKFKLYKKTMLPYCLKCNIYIYIYIYIYIKDQEAKWLLSMIDRIPLIH